MATEQQVMEALQARSLKKQKQSAEKALTEEIVETKIKNRTEQSYDTAKKKAKCKGVKKVKCPVNSRPDVDTISMGYDRFLEILPGDTWKYLPHTFASVMSDGLWKPYPYLVMISNIMATVIARGGGRVLISVPPRHGKLIADDTLILTPDGPRRHGDLRAGDYVFGRDGKPVMVLGVSEKDIADCLVTFSDGQEILAHENHEWIVRDRSCHKEKILETKFFLNNNLSCEGRRGARGHRNRFQVDVNTTLEFPEKQLPLHPYFLGVWLGDGRSSSPDFCGDSKDIAIVTKLESLGYKTSSRWVHETTGVCYYYYRNGVKRILHELNVFNNKHIPDVYLYSSRQQRLDLLAGLVDTDGHRDPRGRYRISTCNEKITHQIKALVNSLGGRTYIMNAQPILSSSGIQGKQVVYQIGFNLPHILPVALERKSNKDIPYVHRCRAITAVRKVSGKPGHCIQVENGVYLVGETLIPTHNSFFISQWLPVWFLANWPHKRVLLSTYEANFAATWGRRARNIVKEKGARVGLYLAEDATASNNWATTAEGGMVTAGVGGPITGKGCLTGDTIITTNIGNITIGEYFQKYSLKDNIHCLTYDRTCDRLIFKRIIARRELASHEIYEIDTTQGRKLRLTGGHPIYDRERGYRPARDLARGDGILCIKEVTKEHDVTPPLVRDSIQKITCNCSTEHVVYDIEVEGTHNYFANGVCVKNCDLGIIDDPHKNWQEASSETTLKMIHEWFDSTFYTRLEPGGTVVILHCLAEGTRVLTHQRGWIPIEDIQVGENVWSFNEKDRLIKQKVKAVVPQGIGKTVVISTKRKTVTATHRHPFMVISGGQHDWELGWKQAGDIKPGDYVLTLKSLPSGSGYKKRIRGKEFMYNDFLWLLGFMYGDGWMVYRKDRDNKPIGFCIAKGEYPDINQRIIDLVKKWFGVAPRETKFGYYRIDNTAAAQKLTDLGFHGNAKTKRLPAWLYHLRRDARRAFLLGILSADGHERKSKSTGKEKRGYDDAYVIGMSNKALVDDCRMLAMTCGVRATRIYEGVQTIQPPHSHAPIESHIYKCEFVFKHKKKELKTIFRNLGNMADVIRIEKVASVENGPDVPVYDLSINGYENFIAEGFISHNTRWNENDLIGYLLREKTTDGWFSIRIPAIAEDLNGEEDVLGRAAGEALCPQRYDTAALNRIRSNMTPMMWNALFQQRPAPMEGSIFIRSKWKYYTVRPKCNFILQSWDTASKKNWDSAYSVCQTWGVSELGAVLLDQWRDKVEYPQLRRQVEVQYLKYRPNVILIEDRDSGQALCQALQQETILPVLPVMPTMDKVIRAQAVSPMQESGRCWLPDPTLQENLWVGEFVDNAATFPNAFFKDEIDSMSQALAYIMTMAMSGRVMSSEKRRTSKLIEGFRDLM